jgi:hypothetical protein
MHAPKRAIIIHPTKHILNLSYLPLDMKTTKKRYVLYLYPLIKIRQKNINRTNRIYIEKGKMQ